MVDALRRLSDGADVPSPAVRFLERGLLRVGSCACDGFGGESADGEKDEYGGDAIPTDGS